MLWANEAEIERVQDLLVKLGEIPSGQQDVRRVRFVQPGEQHAGGPIAGTNPRGVVGLGE